MLRGGNRPSAADQQRRNLPLPYEVAMPWTEQLVAKNEMFHVTQKQDAASLRFKVFIMFNPNAGLAEDLKSMFAIWSSWRRQNIDVHLAISPEVEERWLNEGVKLPKGVHAVVIPEPDVYPPVKFELAMWKKIYEEYNEASTVYIKLDMDTYFNPERMLSLSSKISQSSATYFGKIGFGRNGAFKSRPYCMGFAYAMKASMLDRFANPLNPYTPLPQNVVNSDVAVGTVAGIPCQAIAGLSLHHSYFSVVDGAIAPRLMQGKGHGTSRQTFVPAFTHPPTPIITSVAVHPIKTVSEFTKFNKQVTENLRSAMPLTQLRPAKLWHPTSNELQAIKGQYQRQSTRSCVANIADQIVRYGEPLPPCYYGHHVANEFPLSQVTVPTFHAEEVTRRLQPKTDKLGMQLRLVEASRGRSTKAQKQKLSAGELGYRLSMQRIMEVFLKDSNEDTLFIADDDVMFHRQFSELYSQLDSYCFDGVATNGILKLESSIWHSGTFPKLKGRYVGGWNLIDYEQRQTHSQCYSGHYANVGSVATVYSRKSIQHVLQWLQEDDSLPFDHVFNYLAKIGIPIRTAEPNLAIAKLDKVSEVSARPGAAKADAPLGSHPAYATHRWNVANYVYDA